MSAEDPAGQSTELLIQAAGKAIPKTRLSERLPKVPWFNESCKKTIEERKLRELFFFFVFFLHNAEQCSEF